MITILLIILNPKSYIIKFEYYCININHYFRYNTI